MKTNRPTFASWIKGFFSAKSHELCPAISASELKQRLVDLLQEDNGVNIHIRSGWFTMPRKSSVLAELAKYTISRTYTTRWRCVHYARRLASYFDGRGWAVGEMFVHREQDKTDHALVMIMTQSGPLFIDGETLKPHDHNFLLLGGEIF